MAPQAEEADVVLCFGRAVLMLVTRTTLWGLLGLACCQDSNLPTTAASAAGRATVPLPGWHPPDWQGSSASMETVSSQQLVISALLFAAIKSRTMAPVHLASLVGINMPYGKEICRRVGAGGESSLCLLKANSNASEALQGIAGLMNLQEFWGELLLPWGWWKCPR